MPPNNSNSAVSSSPTGNEEFEASLAAARPFLRGELDAVDEKLPRLLSVLRSAGAGECWHKHGTFFDHLTGVYRILKLWGAPDAVCLCGLFHSSYSNAYVNLAIFDSSTTGRDLVRRHVGDAAENLIHLFCTVPRQPLIHDNLLFKYPDDSATNNGDFDSEESWRKKLNSLIPVDGVKVKHIRTGEELSLSRRLVATFLLITMADFSDELFGFQDELYENSNGRLEFSGSKFETLWPGDCKPGLWMNSISRMGAVYALIVREEEIIRVQRKMNSISRMEEDEDLDLVVPPILEKCTRIVDAEEQMEARELYWEVVCRRGIEMEEAEEMLVKSIEKNPFVGETHLVAAQVYLSQGRFEEGEREAESGLRLLLDWGSPWDKRMSWEDWVAWARVLLVKAKEKSWPNTSWGIRKLGLVR
ncbi:hypothetical protein LINGRAHAP2_LOCUS25681 [Linum grandiflorum]